MVGKDITDPEEIRAVILRVSRDLHSIWQQKMWTVWYS